MPVIYDLYLSWVERWISRSGLARYSALKQEPCAKFETVAAELGDKCRVFVVWHQGRAIASSAIFVHGQHAIGWRSYWRTKSATSACGSSRAPMQVCRR